jgi:hypothetical protein
MQELHLRFAFQTFEGCSREADFSCPRTVNKKAVTYHKWCGSSESGPRGSPFSIPSYLYKDLDKHVLRNFSRFRLQIACTPFESGVLQMA